MESSWWKPFVCVSSWGSTLWLTWEVEICKAWFGNQRFPGNLVIWGLNIAVNVFQTLIHSTQVKTQEKHLLPLLVLLSERRCDVPSTEEVAGVDACVCSLGLAIRSSNSAVTYSSMILCGRRTKSIPSRAGCSSSYLGVKNALLELISSSRTCLFTAKTLKLLVSACVCCDLLLDVGWIVSFSLTALMSGVLGWCICYLWACFLYKMLISKLLPDFLSCCLY